MYFLTFPIPTSTFCRALCSLESPDSPILVRLVKEEGKWKVSESGWQPWEQHAASFNHLLTTIRNVTFSLYRRRNWEQYYFVQFCLFIKKEKKSCVSEYKRNQAAEETGFTQKSNALYRQHSAQRSSLKKVFKKHCQTTGTSVSVAITFLPPYISFSVVSTLPHRTTKLYQTVLNKTSSPACASAPENSSCCFSYLVHKRSLFLLSY